jgi:hypothetical protein
MIRQCGAYSKSFIFISLGFACAQIRSYSLCSLRSNVAAGLFSLTNFRSAKPPRPRRRREV